MTPRGHLIMDAIVAYLRLHAAMRDPPQITPPCSRCGAYHPQFFLWRGTARAWHERKEPTT